jgi:hypothetical protein
MTDREVGSASIISGGAEFDVLGCRRWVRLAAYGYERTIADIYMLPMG